MKKFKAFIALDATNNKKNIEVVKKLYKLVYGFKEATGLFIIKMRIS